MRNRRLNPRRKGGADLRPLDIDSEDHLDAPDVSSAGNANIANSGKWGGKRFAGASSSKAPPTAAEGRYGGHLGREHRSLPPRVAIY